MYSCVVSQYEPIHTPAAPSESAATICRPEPIPPAASTGTLGTDRVDHLGDQHHAGDLAGVPARLVALRDHDVDAAGHVPGRVLGLAGQRGDRDAVIVRGRDHVVGR